MNHRRRRLNWVRVTRDPGVAAAYERSAQASAEWTQALVAAWRGARAQSARPAAATPPMPYQPALPLALQEAGAQ